MAKKKVAGPSSKKGSSSQASRQTQPKRKTAASSNKKVIKTKTASPQKPAASTIKKKSRTKSPSTSSKASKKPSTGKNTSKKSTASSEKKKTTTQRSKAVRPKTVSSQVKSTASSKKSSKKPKKPITPARPTSPEKRASQPITLPKSKYTKHTELSAFDRYNIGGLLACAIDQARDPGLQKFKKALHHLGLSAKEQENLVRVTQGFMFPKLFADEIKDEATRKLAVKELIAIAKTDVNSEQDWQADLTQFASLLGVEMPSKRD